MMRTIPIPALAHRCARFLADAKGLAAVELALILPLMLMLMSLVVFGGQAYTVQRKVTLAATTVANQFATLESPVGEPGVLEVDATASLEQLVARVRDWP